MAILNKRKPEDTERLAAFTAGTRVRIVTQRKLKAGPYARGLPNTGTVRGVSKMYCIVYVVRDGCRYAGQYRPEDLEVIEE